MLSKIRREARRLAEVWTYEPPVFYEVNDAVAPEESVGIPRCSYVAPRVGRRQEAKEDPEVLEEPETSPVAAAL